MGPSPIEEAIGGEMPSVIEAALQRLEPADREAIIARIELGHAYTEVARALGKPTVAAAHVAESAARSSSSPKRCQLSERNPSSRKRSQLTEDNPDLISSVAASIKRLAC